MEEKVLRCMHLFRHHTLRWQTDRRTELV